MRKIRRKCEEGSRHAGNAKDFISCEYLGQPELWRFLNIGPRIRDYPIYAHIVRCGPSSHSFAFALFH
jgi:hypothetical protein